MSGIRTNAAAELLGVSPNTLRSWERRFGYPKPRRTQGGHRQYDLTELESLRRALLETHNISSAIELARQRGEGPSSPARLLDAFDHFDEGVADRVLEESLAVRSVERTVEEVLLPAIELAYEREGRDAERELGSRWATGWLHAARRVVAPASRPQGVLLFDSSPRLDLESLHVQALELGLRRAGFRTLLLAFDLPPERIVRAIRAIDPTAFVFCGGEATLEVVGRLVYTVRQVGSAGPVFEYREAMPVTGEHGIPSLGSRPVGGRRAAQGLRGQRSPRAGGGRARDRARRTPGRVPSRPARSQPGSAAAPDGSARRLSAAAPTLRRGMSSLELGDPLAHRALQALVRAEAAVRRRLAAELERAGVSAAGFSALVVLTTAGGALELRTLRRRFDWSKANATEVTETLETRGLVERRRLLEDRRAVEILLTPDGRSLVERVFPAARRAGQPGLRRARRRREALARRALPQACRLRALAVLRSRPKWATQIVAVLESKRPRERPTPIQRHSLDRITARCSGEAIQRSTVERGSGSQPQWSSRFSPAHSKRPATAIRAWCPK